MVQTKYRIKAPSLQLSLPHNTPSAAFKSLMSRFRKVIFNLFGIVIAFNLDTNVGEGYKIEEIDLREVVAFQSNISITGPGEYACPAENNIIALSSNIDCDNL